MKSSKWRSREEAEDEVDRCLNLIYDDGPLSVEERRVIAEEVTPLAASLEDCSDIHINVELAVYEMESFGFEEEGRHRLWEWVAKAREYDRSSPFLLQGTSLICNSLVRRRFFAEAGETLLCALRTLEEGRDIPKACLASMVHSLASLRGQHDTELVREGFLLLIEWLEKERSYDDSLLLCLQGLVEHERLHGDLSVALTSAQKLLTYPGRVYDCHDNIRQAGFICFEMGRYEESLAYFREMEQGTRQQQGAMATQLCCLALVELGRFKEVEELLSSCSHLRGSSLSNVAVRLLFYKGETRRALALLDKRTQASFTPACHLLRGELLMTVGQFSRARQHFHRSYLAGDRKVDLLGMLPVPFSFREAAMLQAINDCQAGVRTGFEDLEEAIAEAREEFPRGHTRLGSCLITKASALLGQGDRAAAEHAAAEGLFVLQNILPTNHPTVIRAKEVVRRHLRDGFSTETLADEWLRQERPLMFHCPLL